MKEEEPRTNGAVSASSVVRFGPYELDLRTAELRKQDLKIRLQDQPFQILAALLERPGELVLREEIRKKLWPDDTVVEFDHSINAAVKRLRDVLRESAEKPRYIETLARRGYRFIGRVEAASSALGGPAVEAPDATDTGDSTSYTRPDISRERLGYYGVSDGARLGMILLAEETRIRAAALAEGGFSPEKKLPEIDEINFAPRVRMPVLMLNGRYDSIGPVHTAQVPMFRLLGTPERDKRHILFDTGHVLLQHQDIKETLDWFDKYLGPTSMAGQ
jgi:DNA-binding winged helix-turn-helix (wHTH) protein